MAIFCFLYLYASFLYPGGTRNNPATVGYLHFENFWCDLMDQVSYSGRDNPGFIYGLAATLILPLSLIPFWWNLPTLFSEGSPSKRLVQISGMASMLMGCTLPWLHDMALDFACFLLAITFVFATYELFKSKEYLVLSLGFIASAFSLANFLMWKLVFHWELMPIVQKISILLCLSWFVVTSLRVRKKYQ